MFESRLFQVALYGGIAVVVSVTWMERRIQNNFRKQDYYQQPLIMLQKYKPAEQFLGRPIYGGTLDLGNVDKFKVDGVVAKLCIPVKGSKDRGVIHVLASREKPGDRWNVDQLDLEISSTKQKWKFFDRELTLKQKENLILSENSEPSSTSENSETTSSS